MLGWITDNLCWPSWASDAVGVFLGAVVGALFAYLFQRLYHSQETAAKRAELFDWLYHQLEVMPAQLPPFTGPGVHFIDPVDLHAVELLLNGNTLTYKHDKHLVKTLDLTRQNIKRFNLIASHYNSLAVGRPMDEDARRRLYDAVVLKYTPIALIRSPMQELIRTNGLNRIESLRPRILKRIGIGRKLDIPPTLR